jgi:hypothetical protein
MSGGRLPLVPLTGNYPQMSVPGAESYHPVCRMLSLVLMQVASRSITASTDAGAADLAQMEPCTQRIPRAA